MPEPAPSEIIAMDPVRVDGVTSPANGTPFLLIKSLAEDEVDAAEYLAKASAKYDTDARKKLASAGKAMPDGSYPIADEEDLKNAIRAVGRGKADHSAIRKHIIKRAKALGFSDLIPDNWGSDGSLAKDDGTTVDQSDATIPGSSAWETNDAQRLIAAGQLLATAASSLTEAANRERIEVATGHADDMADVYDLSDAVYAVQNALSIVARVAFTEEAEAAAAGAMAKSIRSPETAEAVLRALGEMSLLAKAINPGGATSTGYQKGATMALDINTEELGALIKSSVTDVLAEALPAAVDAALLAKSEADRAATDPAPADPVATDPAAPAADPLAKDAPVGPAVATDPAAPAPAATDNDALLKSIVDANRTALTEVVEPLSAKIDAQDARIEELSKAQRPGGPMVSIPGTGRTDAGVSGEVDLTELEERFEKAAAGSSEKADLGERITKMKLLHEYGLPVKSKA